MGNDMSMGKSPSVRVLYINWRGEAAMRTIVPGDVYYDDEGDNWHPEPGWRMHAYDVEKEAFRDFDLAKMNFLGPASEPEARAPGAQP